MLNKKLSIIIVNYKSEDLLKKCIFSIYNKIKEHISFEIVVVNNDKEEVLSFIKENYSDIKIVTPVENKGFGAGNNEGVKKISGEIILFLNPDTEVFLDNIEKVLNQFSSNSEIGVIGSCLLDIQGRVQSWSAGREMTLFDLILNNIGLSRSKKIWQSNKEMFTEWVSGTALFIKKDIFVTVGGFDEEFFMYFEDMDLCKRVRLLGKKVLYYPEFKVLHRSGKSYCEKNKQKKDYYDSQNKYFKKHKNKLQFLLIKYLRKFKHKFQ